MHIYLHGRHDIDVRYMLAKLSTFSVWVFASERKTKFTFKIYKEYVRKSAKYKFAKMLKQERCLNYRVSLTVIGTCSLILSLAYLFLFSLPHASILPDNPGWQEISLKIVSPGPVNGWNPSDDRYLLLTAISLSLGRFGFNRDAVFNSLLPHWGQILTGTSVFCLVNIMACFLFLSYVVACYRESRKLMILPWIVCNISLFIACLAAFGALLYFLNDSKRMAAEVRENSRARYWEAVSASIVCTIFQYTATIIVIFHYLDDLDDELTYVNMFLRHSSQNR